MQCLPCHFDNTFALYLLIVNLLFPLFFPPLLTLLFALNQQSESEFLN